MSGRGAPPGDPSGWDGGRTAAEGTPVAVNVSRDRKTRVTWAVFLAGPVIWFAHFMLVYLVAEAGCTGDGPGLDVFDPPVPTVVTLVATAVAAVGCLASARWGYRRWRPGPHGSEDPRAAIESDDAVDDEGSRSAGFAGFLLSLLSFGTVLFVGLPALAIPAC